MTPQGTAVEFFMASLGGKRAENQSLPYTIQAFCIANRRFDTVSPSGVSRCCLPSRHRLLQKPIVP